MRDLVFIDTETTGLNPKMHHVWEIAWAVNDGPIETAQVPHNLNHAEPAALRINGYLDRVTGDPEKTGIWWHTQRQLLIDALRDAHLVGSNPAFDARMLEPLVGTPWNHRLVDISAMAMVAIGWHRPKGMADIRKALVLDGYDIPEPDHTAAGDVACLRACYTVLIGNTPA